MSNSAVDFLREVPLGEVNEFIVKPRGRVQCVKIVQVPTAAYFLVTTDTEFLDTMTGIVCPIKDQPPNSIVQYITDRDSNVFLVDVYASYGNIVDFEDTDYVTRLEVAKRLYPMYPKVSLDRAANYEEGVPLIGPYRVI